MDASIESKTAPFTMASRFRGFLPVVVDVETGGFDCGKHALLEIAAVTLRFDGGCKRCWAAWKPPRTRWASSLPCMP